MVLHAVQPAWWTQQETRIIAPQAQSNNYAPVNLGQLKNTAKQAKKHLDIALQQFGGSGSDITTVVNGFVNDPSSNYSPVNLGQLKKVAKPFYERLRQVGFDTRQSLISHGYPATWQYDYPWNPSTPASENYAPANLGQLKMVFSFDVASDTDKDGLPDWWETKNGSDPNDYYNGVLPTLTVVSGNNQSAEPGTFLPEPLVVRVADPFGNPLRNAPITFTVTSGGATIAETANASTSSSLVLRTGGNGVDGGLVSVFCRQPETAGAAVEVVASVTVDSEVAQVVFQSATTTPFSLNPALVDAVVNEGAVASRTVTLTNNSLTARQFSIDVSNGAVPLLHFQDSDQPDGPQFSWVDISTTGTRLNVVSDSAEGDEAVSLSFDFPYFGQVHRTVYVNANGYLTLGASSEEWRNRFLPSALMPPNLIAAFNTDLDLSSSGDVYYLDDGEKVIIQFSNAAFWLDSSAKATFQVVLHQDGTILYYYKELQGTWSEVTVGIQNGDKTEGLTVCHNSNYLKDNLAVRISPAARWLDVSPRIGALAPGESVALAVSLDARTVPPATYNGVLQIVTDPELPAVAQIPVSMAVNDGPQVKIESPAGGLFLQGANLTALASGYDADGIAKIEFYNGTVKLGEVSTAPFSITWNDLPAGIHTITARAFDTLGAARDSEPVSIEVQARTGGKAMGDAWQLKYFRNLDQPDSGDYDEDGVSNADEFALGTNPTLGDTDGDGISDKDEAQVHHTNPLSRDTDGDGMDDRYEIAHGLAPLRADSEDDTDNDGLSNLEEFESGGNPSVDDTDGDGVLDGSDAVPNDPDFTFPRVKQVRYAVIDLGVDTSANLYYASGAINDNGQALCYQGQFDGGALPMMWNRGQKIEMPFIDVDTIFPFVANDGTVVAKTRANVDDIWAWRPSMGASRVKWVDMPPTLPTYDLYLSSAGTLYYSHYTFTGDASTSGTATEESRTVNPASTGNVITDTWAYTIPLRDGTYSTTGEGDVILGATEDGSRKILFKTRYQNCVATYNFVPSYPGSTEGTTQKTYTGTVWGAWMLDNQVIGTPQEKTYEQWIGLPNGTSFGSFGFGLETITQLPHTTTSGVTSQTVFGGWHSSGASVWIDDGGSGNRKSLFFDGERTRPLTSGNCVKINKRGEMLIDRYEYGWIKELWQNNHVVNIEERLDEASRQAYTDIQIVDINNNGVLLCNAVATADEMDRALLLVPIEVAFWEVTGAKELAERDAPALSESAPEVKVQTTQVTNVRPSADGTDLLADITIEASVTSAALDLREGEKGKITGLNWFVNPGAVSQQQGGATVQTAIDSGVLNLNVTKGTAQSDLKPFPYSGTVSQTLVGVKVLAGANVLRLEAVDPVYKQHGHVNVGFVIDAVANPALTTWTDTLSFSFNAAPTAQTQDTLQVSYTTSRGVNLTALLTEDAADSAVYRSADGGVTFTFSAPVVLDAATPETLSVSVTWAAAGLQDNVWSPVESQAASLSFSETSINEDWGAYESYLNYNVRLITEEWCAETRSLFALPYFAIGDPAPAVGANVGPGVRIVGHSASGTTHIYYIEVRVPQDFMGKWGDPTQALKTIEDATGGIYEFKPLPPDYSRTVRRGRTLAPGSGQYYLVKRDEQIFATFQVVAGPVPVVAPDGSALEQATKHLKGKSFATAYGAGFKDGSIALLDTRVAEARALIGNVSDFAGKMIKDPILTLKTSGGAVYNLAAQKVEALASFVPVAAAMVQKVELDATGAVDAYLRGDEATLKELSEPYRDFAYMTAELMEEMYVQLRDMPEHQRAYLLGQMTPGVVELFAKTYVSGGAGAVLSKSNFLKGLPGLRFFQNPRFARTASKMAALGDEYKAAGKMCFVAGTEIATPEGAVAIEDIRPGMYVWSRDLNTGRQEIRPVVETFITHPDKLYHVRFSTKDRHGDDSEEDELVCTGEHPFFVLQRDDFIPANELKAGDKLVLLSGEAAEVANIWVEVAPEGEVFTTYNFEVEDFHTYFAGESAVWVHNHGRGPCETIYAIYRRFRQRAGGNETPWESLVKTRDAMRAEGFVLTSGTAPLTGNKISGIFWRKSAKTVNDDMFAQVGSGGMSLQKLPSHNQIKAEFDGAGIGSSAPRKLNDLDALESHHIIETFIQNELGITGAMSGDDIPGFITTFTQHRGGQGPWAIAPQLQSRIKGKGLPRDEIIRILHDVYVNQHQLPDLWAVTKKYLQWKGFSIPAGL